jgi:acetyltransferase
MESRWSKPSPRSAAEALQAADAVGFPVVLKLFSHTITHKTDVGGVKLNLANAKEVARAFEEIRESVTRIAGPSIFRASRCSR